MKRDHPSRSPRAVGILAAALALGPLTTGACNVPAEGQAPRDPSGLLTRAEATDFVETSRYDDVVSFMETAAAASDRIHLTTMGYTMEGRAIPMAVVGDVADASAEAVRASGKLVLYLQGGIHAGEVPGKEALLMLLRGVATGAYDWSDRVVLLVVPLYNADGNERVLLTNRPRQNGPMGGMGQRANAQGYDLNRDHMKLDAPEARSLARMMTAYDPVLSVDLHTTDGTRHGYWITYAPPLHPGTHRAIVEELRGAMLPALTRTIREEHDIDFYYYGNAQGRGEQAGWYTFDHRPRFNNNYVGLRNRLAILSEAYAYLTYRDRVRATLWFVEDIAAYAYDHAPELEAAVREAGASVVGEELPTRATFQRSDSMVTILMGEVEEVRHPYTGNVILERKDVVHPTPMWEYGTFRATDTEVAPERYLLPAEMGDIADRLRTHGITLEATTAERTLAVEEF
ncbi:MAG TPA: M14 family metallopeptidase, partial [Longimicrobiales bacterium]|nr:M14 family metallopeptidase [Longimicrobiales bacterium]